MVARPEDPPEKKALAMSAIREFKPKCQKLLMNPTACFGCPSNPLKEQPDSDRELYRVYSGTLDTVSRLVDSIRFGWVKGEDLTPLEFKLVRMFDKAIQARRLL